MKKTKQLPGRQVNEPDSSVGANDKDVLSQADLQQPAVPGVQPHPALETAGGKNNGAEPAVFKNQRKSQT